MIEPALVFVLTPIPDVHIPPNPLPLFNTPERQREHLPSYAVRGDATKLLYCACTANVRVIGGFTITTWLSHPPPHPTHTHEYTHPYLGRYVAAADGYEVARVYP